MNRRCKAAKKGNARGCHAIPCPLARLLAVFLIGCLVLDAQEASPGGTALSGLALDNFNRVGASAAAIEAVLRSDPGLMVELKRWVAKEATDQGRIVEDTALTDQGIFDRLAWDLEFRSIATRLLQRYGHLLPRLNPESEAAKEQELVRQQRVRRLLAAEESGERADWRGANAEGVSGPSPNPSRLRQPSQRSTFWPQRTTIRDGDIGGMGSEGNAPGPSIPPGDELVTPGDPPGEIERRTATPMLQAIAAPESATARGGPLSSDGADFSAGALLQTSASLKRSWNDPLAEEFFPEAVSFGAARSDGGGRSMAQDEPGNSEKFGEPAAKLRPNPFSDIPSLFDLYRQVSPRQKHIERFGAEVFRNGPRELDLLPMDLPVGPDYVVGPGDGLTVELWGSSSGRLFRTVDAEGRLALPEVGPLLVSGRTLGDIQQSVQQVLRTQFRDISADVSLSRLRTVRVYVVGDVERPGAYDISSLSTPLNALFQAGGPTERGSLRLVRHYREGTLVQEVDLYDLLLHGVKAKLKRLENGDTVLVPPVGPLVTIDGAVRRPAIYELRGENTPLLAALELAGGILPTAALEQIQVERVDAHAKRTMLSLNLSGSAEVTRELAAFAIQDRDEIHITTIAPYQQDAVYLEGHVLRPGKYSYRQGMKFTDLVASYADLLPEPAARYAEIIRLSPPDYRPRVESFSLAAALENPALAPELQPLDTVRVFGRYDFEDPPTVWIGGEVRNPGLFRTSGAARLRDVIHQAGGLTPDALLETAQVFRYLPNSALKIMSVHLREALAGNPQEDILLQPRDRIVVHRNPAKVDPPSVYVKGEVAKPGRYPLTEELRVADLIRLAGGLKRSAYEETADLTRFITPGAESLGEHQEIRLGAALRGDAGQNLLLRDGDVLTVRQRAGWNDIGASVAVLGEVEHPGTYGIQPDERLSSLLQRAGGFRPTAYPRAAVLERASVRELQERSRQELIRRIEQEAVSVKVSLNESGQDQAELQRAALLQRERVLESLRQTPVTGRLVIRLPNDLSQLKGSADDLELRPGDRLYIPKEPNFVVVTGQVYNSNAITFVPGKNAGWYLRQAGGATALADKGAIFIVRADGSVETGKGEGWWGGSVLSAPVLPGDTIVVPEKPIGGQTFWKNVLSVAQVVQSASLAALVATR